MSNRTYVMSTLNMPDRGLTTLLRDFSRLNSAAEDCEHRQFDISSQHADNTTFGRIMAGRGTSETLPLLRVLENGTFVAIMPTRS